MKVSSELDGFEDRRYPGMICPILETMKRFAEREIPNNVKCGKIIPLSDINFPCFGSLDLLTKFADEKVNVRCDEWLLLPECLFGKCVCEQPAHAGVIRVTRGGNNVVDSFGREPIERMILPKTFVAWTVTIDIFPGLWTIEGELVWSYSDNVPILIVKVFDSAGQFPTE